MKSKVRNYLSAAAVAVLAAAGSASAALDLTGVTVDTTDYISIATFLVTALVAFWGVKKGIGLLRG